MIKRHNAHENSPILKIRNLSFRFHNARNQVLRNINLDLYSGEFILLIGPSGCGKSTLSLCINGLIPHFVKGDLDGYVIVEDKNTRDSTVGELATKVGIVFQDPESQLCNLRVKNEIAFGCENILLPVDEINNRINKYTSLLGLSHLVDSLCTKLSEGQKQKVSLASVLAMEPAILILDEPTSNLDSFSANKIIYFLRKLREKNDTTILLIEHKMDKIIDLVNRVIVMNRGQIIFQGEPREIFAKHGQYLRSELGVWIPQIADFILEVKEKENLPLSYFPLTLDEAFRMIKKFDFRFKKIIESKKERHKKLPLYRIKDLSFRYEKDINVLTKINLIIDEGIVMAIVGPNGSGKTTFGKLLVGLLKPSQGKIIYQNKDITSIPLNQLFRQVGFIFQNADAQFIKQTVHEEMCHSLTQLFTPSNVISKSADDLLKRYRLLHVKSHNPLDLSIGEKRRLTLAIYDPFPLNLLVLDEPTMGLDRIDTIKLMDLLKKKHNEGTSIIIITHEMRLLTDFVERVILLDSGIIKADITPQEFFFSPELYELSSVLEPPVVTLFKKLIKDEYNYIPQIALTPEELYKSLERRA